MDWCISEPLIVEANMLVQPVKVFLILFRAEEPQIADFKIAEELVFAILVTCLDHSRSASELTVFEIGKIQWVDISFIEHVTCSAFVSFK
jgi:hypothetical protein